MNLHADLAPARQGFDEFFALWEPEAVLTWQPSAGPRGSSMTLKNSKPWSNVVYLLKGSFTT